MERNDLRSIGSASAPAICATIPSLSIGFVGLGSGAIKAPSMSIDTQGTYLKLGLRPVNLTPALTATEKVSGHEQSRSVCF